MNGRLGTLTGEQTLASGQYTRTNCVGTEVTTMAAGSVATNGAVAPVMQTY